MISRSTTTTSVFWIFAAVLLFSVYGCYTSFQHPPVNDSKWGTVRISDDCSECHTQNQYTTPILPDAAQKDLNWQFYSASPWWGDEMMPDASTAYDAPEPTGPRHATDNTGWVTTPAAPMPSSPVQSLGKSGASAGDGQNGDAAKDGRRSVGRRKVVTSGSEGASSEKRTTRSRRNED